MTRDILFVYHQIILASLPHLSAPDAMALRSTILTLLLASFVLSAFTYSDPEPEAGPHAQPRFLRPLQTVGVTVTLTCFGQPAPNVKVKLMNNDSWCKCLLR